MTDPSPLLTPLDTRVPPVQVPAGYRAAAAAVAVGMVLLPLLYVALVVALAAGVVWFAANGLDFLGGVESVRVIAFAYGAPLLIGALMVLFLVKPLFAPRRKRGEPIRLTRDDEPTLFAFVERLAAAVGAPVPRQIHADTQANASASFRRGVLSMAGSDLVLTVGLPLADALSARQFAGVVAHEFGHFAQGGGMRLAYLVEQISRWFERVVYERDAFDDRLDASIAATGGMWVGGALRLARGGVTVGRWVLRGLMTVGRRLSRSLLRQMEFDADRYEVRVAGVEAFRQTNDDLAVLGAATNAAFADVDRLRREGRLPNDLPAFVAATSAGIPGEARTALLDDVRTMRTGPLDTHPAPSERVASAEREGAAGLDFPDLPARALFSDFDALARRVTAAFYRDVLGDAAERLATVDTASAVAERSAETSAFEALDRLLLGVPSLPDPPPDVPEPPVESALALASARETCAALADPSRAAAERFGEAHGQRIQTHQAEALVKAQVTFEAADYGLAYPNGSAVKERRREVEAAIEKQEQTLDAFDDAVRQRIGLALAVLPSLNDPARDEVSRWLDALRAIREVRDDANALGDNLAAVHTLLQAYQAKPSAEHIAHVAAEYADRLRATLVRLRGALLAVPYPFDRSGTGLSLGQFIIAAIPPPSEGMATIVAADEAAQALREVRARTWAALASTTERVEAAVGVAPESGVQSAAA